MNNQDEYISRFMQFFCTIISISDSPKWKTYYCNLNSIANYKMIDTRLKQLEVAIMRTTKRVKSYKSNFAFRIEKQDIPLIAFKDHSFELNSRPSLYSAYIGATDDYKPLYIDFTKNTHLLIAGATGSGKSVALNTLICDMIKTIPNKYIKFVFVDTKMVELSRYNKLNNLLCPVITNVEECENRLNQLVDLMNMRYKELEEKGIRDINNFATTHIFIIIDEYADLVLSSPSIQDNIIKIAQKGRACGMHLIIATQRPTREVLSGLIKANLTSRIALQTASIRDSINILDHKGAEELRGKGDSLIKLNDRVDEYPTQIAYISDEEIEKIIENAHKPL